ncbi:cytochrome P450 [Aspergillus homomorphus CBS 101889]|uniref:P450 family sporulation-specific N-formyltyrosine oxidase Dit2 n=1 Tax=Aspergillus homomorphus (strain CBS 101889) TaxID=1450537 RepID=A0A395I1K5_ASPHC|nr:P450 family sporulation-specific N-formyltyrosine oxidase Dit2 [Aspergillus homomorphus CBS 101889]RAL12434.1 P450 family sporulation-specific N-formyltyrosine oxidase Dit2 [Aspergillus homomorphus CBS 101889]
MVQYTTILTSLGLTILTTLVIKIYRALTTRCQGLPSIPFVATVYDAYRGVSEIRFHNTRLRPVLEAHGAVNLWNSGQWTVLVTRPEYVVRILRNERMVAKGGFYRKVPGSRLAGLFGENLIDSHGEVWKQFTTIMKPGIQRAHKISTLQAACNKLVATVQREQQKAAAATTTATTSKNPEGIVINDLIERWAIDVFGEMFFDVQFAALDDVQRPVRAQSALNAILWSLGNHLTGAFPLLERIGAPLCPARPHCFAMIRELEEALIEITDALPDPSDKNQADKLIYRMRGARDSGQMSDFHYRSNLKMLFFAGHENVKFAFIAALWELSQSSRIQDKLYHELVAATTRHQGDHADDASDDDLKHLPYLTAVVSETLRLYPPVSQLINRKTLAPVPLGDNITIPEGTWVGWTAYGVHTDQTTWGPDAHVFRPERWGDDVQAIHKAISQHQVRGSYIPFNAWTRSCVGSEFALLQLRITLAGIVRKFKITSAPGYTFSIAKNGSLEPYNCRLIFTDRT